MENQKPQTTTAFGQFQNSGGDLVIAVMLILFLGAMLFSAGAGMYYRGFDWYTWTHIGVIVALGPIMVLVAWKRLIAFGKWADEAKKKWQKP